MDIIFPYCTIALTFLFLWFMPKRLSRKEIYITWAFLAALTVNIDLIFGVIYDLYDFCGSSEIDFYDLPLEAALAPSFGIIYLNFMPGNAKKFVLYLIGVVLFSCFYEWLSIQTGYINYKGWKLIYSAPFYLLGMVFLRWHLHYLRKRP